MWEYSYGYMPMHFIGGLLSILWWIFVIWAIVHVVRWMRHEGRRGGFHFSSYKALEILKERYAKGEIDKKEFDEKKKDLE